MGAVERSSRSPYRIPPPHYSITTEAGAGGQHALVREVEDLLLTRMLAPLIAAKAVALVAAVVVVRMVYVWDCTALPEPDALIVELAFKDLHMLLVQ